MQLLSPVAKPLARSVSPVARPRSLANLRIGLLDNTKAPVDVMMTHLRGRLAARFPDATIFSIAKQAPLAPAEPEVLAALKERVDIVINALGD